MIKVFNHSPNQECTIFGKGGGMDMNLILNPLNSKTNAEEKVNVDELTLWRFYYSFLNLKSKSLTANEINFLACFTINSDIDYVCEKLNMQKSNYYGMIRNLTKKNLIHKNDNSYSLHLNIQKLKEYVTKNKPSVTFIFPLNIEYDTGHTD